MPTYDYRCEKCGHQFEVFHGMRERKTRRCPRCKGRARRVISGGAGLIFKGSGFYITDHRSKDYKEKAKQEKSAGAKPASGESKSSAGPKRGPEKA
jgi:putative FmdB family regulatory protein